MSDLIQSKLIDTVHPDIIVSKNSKICLHTTENAELKRTYFSFHLNFLHFSEHYSFHKLMKYTDAVVACLITTQEAYELRSATVKYLRVISIHRRFF